MQNKADLGKRYSCYKCMGKFYDLNRPEAICPKCGADQAENPQPDPRVAVMSKYKSSSRSAPKKKPADPYAGKMDDAPAADDTAADDDDDTAADDDTAVDDDAAVDDEAADDDT